MQRSIFFRAAAVSWTGVVASGVVLLLAGCGGPGSQKAADSRGAARAEASGDGDSVGHVAGAPDSYRLDPAVRASADEWYLPVAEGCQLYVREFGTGDTVVVLHGGWGAEHSYLLTPFRGLERDHHLVFYDQRGSLRSPCPDSLVNVDAHVADLDRLREALGIERLTLAGHSMGTWLAMKYLQAHPERVGGMVLLDALIPRLGPDDVEEYSAEQAAFDAWRSDSARLRAVIEAEGLDRPLEALTDRERTHLWRIHFAQSNIFHLDRWRQMEGGQVFYDQSAGSAAGKSMNANAGWNFLEDLRDHPYPVTVVIGDHDLVGFGGALHRRQLANLPNVHLIVLKDAGHNAWVDQPGAFRDALAGGLELAGRGRVQNGAAASSAAASGVHRDNDR